MWLRISRLKSRSWETWKIHVWVVYCPLVVDVSSATVCSDFYSNESALSDVVRIFVLIFTTGRNMFLIKRWSWLNAERCSSIVKLCDNSTNCWWISSNIPSEGLTSLDEQFNRYFTQLRRFKRRKRPLYYFRKNLRMT